MVIRRHVLFATGRYFPKVHRGVARYAREHGWHLNSEAAQLGELPPGWRGDGILTGIGQNIKDSACPVVHIGTILGDPPQYTISEDNRTIAQLAVGHFLERHFRNFCYYSRYSQPINRRLTMFAEEVEAAGYSCCNLNVPKDISQWEERHNWLGKQLQKLPKPIALFAASDDMAAEVIEACQDFGVLVPEEVAVLGVRNDELVCESIPIPLSSVENDHDKLGYEAAKLLDRLMNGENIPFQHFSTFPEKVIARQSTDVMAVPHPEVAKALGYIRQNYKHSINVDNIVNATKLSKIGLYKAFNRHLDRTPAQELIRIRLEHAREMLLETDLKISEIAYNCGFGDYHTLYFSFKKEFKMTPKQLRNGS